MTSEVIDGATYAVPSSLEDGGFLQDHLSCRAADPPPDEVQALHLQICTMSDLKFEKRNHMAIPARPIPDDQPQVSPHLCVKGADDAIEFYRTVFGTTERMRLTAPDGRIAYAEIALGESVLRLSDEFPNDMVAPGTVGGTSVTLSVYIADVDAVFARAVQAGASSLQPVVDQFYGDRAGQFIDPFGHRWQVATRIEDMSPAEMAARAGRAS